MKVLIINTNRQRSPHTLIPLGACLVAASARSAGHQVRFLDLTFHRHPEYVVSSAVKELSPDVTGLSVRNLDNCEMTNPR
ncbi:MAG TPA: cobalamin-dependent protein, partial [Armatimonadota bacterium]|nr:cobalamin-dependent protein [Armatimonadota bacterium]